MLQTWPAETPEMWRANQPKALPKEYFHIDQKRS